jgi:hypothetical protein
MKLKRVVRLRINVYADDLKACTRIAFGSPAGAAEKVK